MAGTPRNIWLPCPPPRSARFISPAIASESSKVGECCGSTTTGRESFQKFGSSIPKRWRVSVRSRPSLNGTRNCRRSRPSSMKRRGLVEHDDGEAAGYILADGLASEGRLNVYRNTFIGALTTALRLAYPAVHRLVGPEFFEGAARIFIEKEPPRGAYLDGYGSGFPEFLAQFRQAASLAYLPDVARLEWTVSRALHAPDVEA